MVDDAFVLCDRGGHRRIDDQDGGSKQREAGDPRARRNASDPRQ